MIVHQIQVGGMQNFTYVVEDENTNEGIVIDPSWDLDKVQEVISRNSSSDLFCITKFVVFSFPIVDISDEP